MNNKHLVIILTCAALVGCSTSTQYARTKVFDPKTGIVTEQESRANLTALGNGKAIADSVRASAGKTASVGAKGGDVETDAIDKSNTTLELLLKLLGK